MSSSLPNSTIHSSDDTTTTTSNRPIITRQTRTSSTALLDDDYEDNETIKRQKCTEGDDDNPDQLHDTTDFLFSHEDDEIDNDSQTSTKCAKLTSPPRITRTSDALFSPDVNIGNKSMNILNRTELLTHLLTQQSIIADLKRKLNHIDSTMNTTSSSSTSSSSVLSTPVSSLTTSSSSSGDNIKGLFSIPPQPLTREQFNEKYISHPLHSWQQRIDGQQLTIPQMKALHEFIKLKEKEVEEEYKVYSGGHNTLESFCTMYMNPLVKPSKIALQPEPLNDEQKKILSDAIIDELKRQEKEYLDQIYFMHSDYTMDLWAKKNGFKGFNNNLDFNDFQIWRQSPKKLIFNYGKPQSKYYFKDIISNKPLIITSAIQVGDFCFVYPNGDFMSPRPPLFKSGVKYSMIGVETTFDDTWFGNSPLQKILGNNGINPLSPCGKFFDKLSKSDEQFDAMVWDTNDFASVEKEPFRKDIPDTKLIRSNPEEYEKKLNDIKESFINSNIKNRLVSERQSIRVIYARAPFFRFPTDVDISTYKQTPYVGPSQWAHDNYYKPEELKKKQGNEGVPTKRLRAIPMVHSALPLYRARTLDEMRHDRNNGLVNDSYDPFIRVPYENSYIKTGDIVHLLLAIDMDSNKPKRSFILKGIIWIKKSSSLPMKQHILTDKDDPSTFFYAASEYYTSDVTPPNPCQATNDSPEALKADLDNFIKTQAEEELYTKK